MSSSNSPGGDHIAHQAVGDPGVGAHSRLGVQRLFSHDAYHCGELSQTLGIAELPQIDLWD